MFQETFITDPGKIPYIWRANFHLTAGLGNSQGCLTLLPRNIQVIEFENIGNQAHVLACLSSGENNPTHVLANVYAPYPNTQEKIDFLEELLSSIDEFALNHNCPNIFIAGDFNINYKSSEVKNRNYSQQEKNVAKVLKDKTNALILSDSWSTKHLFTWRRPNTDPQLIESSLIKTNLQLRELKQIGVLACPIMLLLVHTSIELMWLSLVDQTYLGWTLLW